MLGLIALALLVAIPFVGMDGYRSVRNQHLIRSSTWCADHDPPCLKPVTGTLGGPFWTRRDPGHGWSLYVDGTKYDGFDADEAYDSALRGVADNATAFVVGGDVVAVDTPDGYVPVWGLGPRGAIKSGLLCLGFLGGAIAAVDYGRRKAAARGSWWTLDGSGVSQTSSWAASLLIPVSFGYLALLFTPWWQLWMAAFAAGCLVAGWFLLPWPGRPSFGRNRVAEPDAEKT